jgi:hypothetical protein
MVHGAEHDTDLHVGEESFELRFASRGDNDWNDGGRAVEGGVEEIGVVVAEGDVAPGFGARVGQGETGGVGVALEEHVGGANGTVVVGVLGCTSNQSVEGRHEGLSGMGLWGSEAGDGFKDGGVVAAGMT